MRVGHRNRRSADEGGFILVSAMWLLILCGSIVALFMLRASSNAVKSSGQEEALRTKLSLDSAVETVAADLLINGRRSRWFSLPATGPIDIGKAELQVSVSGENGRLDLNDADPRIIASALQGLGVAPAERQTFLTSLDLDRRLGKRISSWAEVRRRLQPLHPDQGVCLEDVTTITSGLRAPQDSEMPGALRAALGRAVPVEASPALAGEALRVIATAERGAELRAVIRIIGFGNTDFVSLDWEYRHSCLV